MSLKISPKRYLTHDGRTESINYWADKIGISREALIQRLITGWTVAEAVTTPRYNRAAKRVRRKLARVITDDLPHTPVASATTPSLDELKSNHLKQQRAVNRTLRQFCRDLDAIMSRGVDRDLLKARFDRSIPVTPERG
jgi:hypothetical protein